MDVQIEKLVEAVSEIRASLPAVADAIDALEAKITAALANAGLSQEDRDAIAAAIDDLRDAGASLASAVSDAEDGVDEAAQPPSE